MSTFFFEKDVPHGNSAAIRINGLTLIINGAAGRCRIVRESSHVDGYGRRVIRSGPFESCTAPEIVPSIDRERAVIVIPSPAPNTGISRSAILRCPPPISQMQSCH